MGPNNFHNAVFGYRSHNMIYASMSVQTMSNHQPRYLGCQVLGGYRPEFPVTAGSVVGVLMLRQPADSKLLSAVVIAKKMTVMKPRFRHDVNLMTGTRDFTAI